MAMLIRLAYKPSLVSGGGVLTGLVGDGLQTWSSGRQILRSAL